MTNNENIADIEITIFKRVDQIKILAEIAKFMQVQDEDCVEQSAVNAVSEIINQICDENKRLMPDIGDEDDGYYREEELEYQASAFDFASQYDRNYWN